jgi:pimeloyl-ACP methyl ester carboxylesterase
VVLVHGGSAHGGWWAGVAKLLASTYRVVVPDLSGHGRSDHRKAYGPSVWARDVEEAVKASRATEAFLIGHSMGGAVGVYLAASRPDLVEGLVLVDTALRPSAEDSPDLRSARRHNAVYATREAILERFRLLPPGVLADQRLLLELAEESIVLTSNGWTWRHDPEARQRFTDEGLAQQIPLIRCPVAYLAGELSTISDESAVHRLQQQLGREVGYTVVPDAYHHVPLDAPAMCAAAIQGYVSQWLGQASDA